MLFSEYSFFIPTLISIIIIWGNFFKSNFVQLDLFFQKKDYTSNKYFNKTIQPLFYISLNKLIIFISILNLFFLKGYSISFWSNHFKFTNLNLTLTLTFLSINLLYLVFSSSLFLQKYSYKSEFFFALVNLTVFLPIIFFINTLFTFFFFIELNSSLVFFKFINSSSSLFKKRASSLESTAPKYYVNMLFFQYWATFFSSILFVYVIIIYTYMYGTTEWVILNFLNFNQSLYFSTNTITNTLLNFTLIFSFFIKVGLTPVHLYKLEIYKGLPYISIFFYTTFYFLVFFLFFLIFFLNYLGSFVLNYWYVYILCIIVGMFYTINLLFNVNLLKIFFAYSTMINSLGFICGGLSLLNC